MGASVAAERFGPFWGGLIACFPISAGPAYILLGLQHDDAFIAESAFASFACGVATWTYALVFVRLGQRFSLLPTLMGTLTAWFIVAFVVRSIPWSLVGAIAANIAAFLIALKFTPRVAMTIDPHHQRVQVWYELPLRAVSVGVFVATIVTVSDAIGPVATGIASVFPIAMTSLAVIMNLRFGMVGARATIAATVRPMVGIVIAMLFLALTAEPLTMWPAMALALLISMVVPLVIAKSQKRA